MLTSYIIYALCAVLLIWGGKFAGFKNNQFHEDSSSLEVTKALRGFAAIGVIIHHIALEQAFQKANGKGVPGELSLFLNAGYRCVAIFFFCSGYGLIKSYLLKPDYLKSFLRKRVVNSMVIPYYVSVVIYAVFRFAMGEHLAPAEWVLDFSGFTLMNNYAWYPIVAVIVYVTFYLTFKHIKNQKICFVIMAAVILLMGAIFCVNGHFVWWTGEKNWWLDWNHPLHQKWWTSHNLWWFCGEWWVNSVPALFVGMLYGRFEPQIREWFKKLYWLKLAVVVAIFVGFYFLTGFALSNFGYWTEYSGNGIGTANKFITYFLQIPESMWLCVTLFVIMQKYYVVNPVARFFGNFSFETYMMNLIAITLCRVFLYTKETVRMQFGMQPYYWNGRLNLLVYAACVLALSVVLGVGYKAIYKKICFKVKA